jgi:hypothetical protein
MEEGKEMVHINLAAVKVVSNEQRAPIPKNAKTIRDGMNLIDV